MFTELKNNWNRKSLQAKAIRITVLGSLMMGLWLSAGPKPAVCATPQESGAPVPAVGSPAMPGSFADLAEKLSPSVVNVKVTRVEKATMQGVPVPDGPFGEFFERRFRDLPQSPRNHQVQGAGSGVIISHDGTLLTNNHVVEDAKEVTVTLADQREFKAQIVGRDPKTDLAVLKIDASEPLPAATLGNSEQLKVGDWVLAIGNPFGLSHTVTSGIVSAKGRIIGAGPYDDFIQTDASINPGNSGGPLYNMQGELVGINTAIVPNAQGIGFAIPVNTAKPLIPQLVATGEVTRGYLGVNIQPITAELASALQLKDTEGALVADVVPGSPADKAGIKRGDVILAYNNKPVKESRDLPSMVAGTPVGDEAGVTVLRDGKESQLSAKIAKLRSEETGSEEPGQAAKGRWGLALQDVSPQVARKLGLKTEHGALIVNVQPGSPADRASIQNGDVILEVNRQPVSSVEECKEVIARAEGKDSLLLLLQRGPASLYVALKG